MKPTADVIHPTAEQVDDWISAIQEGMFEGWMEVGSFETFKKANPVQYEITLTEGVVETLEGNVNHSAGAVIITGPKGERYPVEYAKFISMYDVQSDTQAIPKKIIKLAKLADHDGKLYTPWGNLEYKNGEDFIVRHKVGDYGVVKKDIFEMTYDVSKLT